MSDRGTQTSQEGSSRDVPKRPDYLRLRREVERGEYPFSSEDEAALFMRAEWLEKELHEVLFAVQGIWRACQQRAAEDWRVEVGLDARDE